MCLLIVILEMTAAGVEEYRGNYIHYLTQRQLRSAANAHFSIRKIAQRMAEEIRRVYPFLGEFMFVKEDESWREVDDGYFI